MDKFWANFRKILKKPKENMVQILKIFEIKQFGVILEDLCRNVKHERIQGNFLKILKIIFFIN